MITRATIRRLEYALKKQKICDVKIVLTDEQTERITRRILERLKGNEPEMRDKEFQRQMKTYLKCFAKETNLLKEDLSLRRDIKAWLLKN